MKKHRKVENVYKNESICDSTYQKVPVVGKLKNFELLGYKGPKVDFEIAQTLESSILCKFLEGVDIKTAFSSKKGL